MSKSTEPTICPMCGEEKSTNECPACGEAPPVPPPKPKSYVAELLISTIIGCFVGAILLGPIMR